MGWESFHLFAHPADLQPLLLSHTCIIRALTTSNGLQTKVATPAAPVLASMCVDTLATSIWRDCTTTETVVYILPPAKPPPPAPRGVASHEKFLKTEHDFGTKTRFSHNGACTSAVFGCMLIRKDTHFGGFISFRTALHGLLRQT